MKKLICTFLTILCIASVSTTAFAIDVQDSNKLNTNDNIEIVDTRSQVIVWKFRVYKGKLQKRRWNETLGVWVDSHWINA